MLLVLGLGHAGGAVARLARAAGWAVAGTSRAPDAPGVLPFAAAGEAIRAATHLLITTPPTETGDPVLEAHAAAVEAALTAGGLRWVGYVSTTGVYGDRAGASVDETAEPTPAQPRSRRRLAAEQAWRDVTMGRVPLDLMRAGGIYGPGRSALDDLRAGKARRIVRPGHVFTRIHSDDIAQAALAAMTQDRPPVPRVLHLVDDEPAESAAVVAYAAALLGMDPPPAIPFEDIRATLSPMALSFWSESRRVTNAMTKAALGLAWRYPSYREGLAAILAEERRQGLAQ
ncbi:SDR family NAD(P)-dependent oxidoreductase [Roseomonas alba]|nr:SDR family NAD(P)-dependent oxidoreductase [Neoroseomonas alba]